MLHMLTAEAIKACKMKLRCKSWSRANTNVEREKLANGDLYRSNDYDELLSRIEARIRSARRAAAMAVNRELITLYWSIGELIVEHGNHSNPDEAMFDLMSQDIKSKLPNRLSFSPNNLRLMRQFYITYRGASQTQLKLVREIPWGHNIEVFQRVTDAQAREYYLRACLEKGWSRAMLIHQIEVDAYSHLGNDAPN